jgi:hypothetical protein
MPLDRAVLVRLATSARFEAAVRALPGGAYAAWRAASRYVAGTTASAGAALGPRPVEQLLGVRPEALDELVARGVPVRVYVPFGHNWFRYWMRRLAESRGA